MTGAVTNAGNLKDKLPTGVYWGRFNPPHSGHLGVIRRFHDRMNLVIAIGSSEHKNEKSNPFSGAERKAMMDRYLRESGIRGVRVVTLRDGPSESWAIDELIRKCKPDLLLLSTEKRGLADLAERRVRVVRFRRTNAVSSSRIRDLIAAGPGNWKALTGASVSRWIEEHDGLRRIRRTYGLPQAAASDRSGP